MQFGRFTTMARTPSADRHVIADHRTIPVFHRVPLFPVAKCALEQNKNGGGVMSFRTGDAVRLRPGSDLYELLDAWADLTGRVAGVYDAGAMISVDYPPPFAAYTSSVPATEFLPDHSAADAPF